MRVYPSQYITVSPGSPLTDLARVQTVGLSNTRVFYIRMMLLFEMQNDGTAARNGTLPTPTVARPPSSHRAPASSPAHDSCGFGSRIWAWGPVDGHTRTTAPSPVYNISHKYRVGTLSHQTEPPAGRKGRTHHVVGMRALRRCLTACCPMGMGFVSAGRSSSSPTSVDVVW